MVMVIVGMVAQICAQYKMVFIVLMLITLLIVDITDKI